MVRAGPVSETGVSGAGLPGREMAMTERKNEPKPRNQDSFGLRYINANQENQRFTKVEEIPLCSGESRYDRYATGKRQQD